MPAVLIQVFDAASAASLANAEDGRRVALRRNIFYTLLFAPLRDADAFGYRPAGRKDRPF